MSSNVENEFCFKKDKKYWSKLIRNIFMNWLIDLLVIFVILPSAYVLFVFVCTFSFFINMSRERKKKQNIIKLYSIGFVPSIQVVHWKLNKRANCLPFASSIFTLCIKFLLSNLIKCDTKLSNFFAKSCEQAQCFDYMLHLT